MFGLTLILLKIEQRLSLNHCYLIRISRERVDVQFTSSGLKVNIAERLKIADFQLRKLDKNTSIACETLKVGVTLPI